MVSEKVYKECSDVNDEKTDSCWTDKVPARLVLYFLSFTGFLVSSMMRFDINIAIVAMAKQHPVNTTEHIITKDVCIYDENRNTTSTNLAGYTGILDWSISIQGYIIAAFFWGYVPSQIVGGIIAHKWGPKLAFGLGQLFTALGGLCMPWAADIHWSLVILIRFIQGFASGFTWPAMYAIIPPWVPITERSRFMSSLQGFNIGIGLTFPLCGFLIAQFGWRAVFYTTGSIGVIWCIFWYFLVFNSPDSHPRIGKSEKEFIRNNIEPTLASGTKHTIPWRSIITSKAVWAIAICSFGRIWIHAVFLALGPQYMKNILQFSIKENGLINGAPFLLCYLFSLIFCYATDKLFTKNYMSLLNCRRLMTGISQIIPGVLILSITYMGCDIYLILIVWFLAIIIMTAANAGALANPVDISPHFSGAVMAFTQTIHMTASFICPVISFSFLEGQDYLISAWKNVFYLAAFITISTCIFYQFMASAKAQEWDNPSNEDEEEAASEGVKFLEKPEIIS